MNKSGGRGELMELNSSRKHFVSASFGVTHTHIFMHMTYVDECMEKFGNP